MKFIHIADLHLGKRYNEFSLIEDQKFILGEIARIAAEERADGVIIAGDIYDKSTPSAEAVELFDGFLNSLNGSGLKVFAVSGNHDSAERVAFGASLMAGSGAYFSPVYCGSVQPVRLTDEYGELNVYLLPFVKPATVRRFFVEKIESYNDALKAAVEAMNIDGQKRNILVAHQFVTGSLRAGSEEITVGDAGNVDASVFAPFDYAALGHIHGAQNAGTELVRYSGAPLKYSLNELKDTKSVTVVNLRAKGDIQLYTVPLTPLRDMAEIRGAYNELTKRSYYEGTNLTSSLVHAVLTDEEDVPDAFAKLRIIYPYLKSVRYDNARTRGADLEIEAEVAAKSPLELFSALFEAQNGREMSGEQEEFVKNLIERVWDSETC